MRRSPRRPLILKRRKLPFQLNDPPANVVPSKEPHGGTTTSTTTPTPDDSSPKPIAVNPCFPDGIHVVAHPTMPDMQVVVIPQTADLQCVIGALTAKGKEHGPHGPNKFILLSGSGGLENESGFLPSSEGDAPPPPRSTGRPPGKVKEEPSSLDIEPLTGLNQFNKDLDCSPLDDSLTNIQWLGRMSTDTVKGEVVKENSSPSQQEPQQADGVRMEGQAEGPRDTKSSLSDRPPYSYMAMIQFAINSKASRRMTLKDIYTWIEDHFPFFQQQTKPGWKNSIRHNLSLHDMFTRETSPDGKVSYWTIRPEANRCLTLDQVYKPGSETTITLVPVPRPLVPHQEQTGMFGSSLGRGSRGCVRRMKPLLPRSESYLVPIQLPASAAGASIYLPSPALCSPHVQLRPAPQRTRVTPRAKKRVRIAPKVAHIDGPALLVHPITPEVKEEAVSRALTPCRDPRRGGAGGGGGSSRRKQRLVLPSHEEPVLFPDSTFFDSGLASDASGFQDPQQVSPTSRELSFKTPVKGGGGSGGSSSSSSSSSSHLASSTPSKPPGLEPWKVTPRGKSTQQAMLDFSPIRTPSGPLHTPQHLHHHLHDYSSFSFSGTPFRELPLFSSPRELLSSSCGRAPGAGDSPPAAGRSLEGLMLDTLNDSLSKVLVDISFSALEDEDMGAANISWSEFIPQMM